MAARHYTLLDKVLMQVDTQVRALAGAKAASPARYPARDLPTDDTVPIKEIRRRAALMRVNHAGEICAQALYHGQALTAKTPAVKALLTQSGEEEAEHLAFCAARIAELNDHVSYLAALWYLQSFFLGACVGLLGDAASLGFLAETEQQVVAHLDKHLQTLGDDARSTAILQQMRLDEASHGEKAIQAGGQPLPPLAKWLMRRASQVMTGIAYYL